MAYDWFLKTFKTCYPNEPKIVLTDQDPSLKQVVPKNFLNARHRLCMWHITEKISTKVGPTICMDGFKAKLSKIVWADKLSPEVFVDRWFGLLKKFNVENNKWLSNMFELSENWIPAYFRDWEMSGLMRTSSRSESQNHVFGQLMSAGSTLVEFFTRFETAILGQRFNYSKNQHESSYTTRKFRLNTEIEKEAAFIYTRSVFYDVQKEMIASSDHCMSMSYSISEGIKKLIIVDNSVKWTDIDETIDREIAPNFFDELIPTQSLVSFNQSQGEIVCSCRKFERFGLLCRHIYYVLRMCKVENFPKKYICKRWTVDALPPKSLGIDANTNKRQQNLELLRDIFIKVDKSIGLLLPNTEKFSAYRDSLNLLLQKIQEDVGLDSIAEPKEFIGAMMGLEVPKYVDVFPPSGVRNKGQRRKRIKSSREKSTKKVKKKKRQCKKCFEYKHDSRNCEAYHEAKRLKKIAKEPRRMERVSSSNFEDLYTSSEYDSSSDYTSTSDMDC